MDRGRMRQSVEHGLFVRAVDGSERGGAERSLLYIHGLGESGLAFESLLLAPELGSWSQRALDLDGYGKSSWPERTPSLEGHATRIVEWLDAANLANVFLIGHSMGGVVAQLVCETAPSRVRAFVNVEGNLSLEDCVYSRRFAAYTARELEAHGQRAILDEVFAGAREDPALRTYYPSLRLCDPRALHQNAVELVELSATERLAHRFAALEVPRLYLYGDPRGTGSHSRALLAAAGQRPQAIENAGHWPFVDQPTSFLRQLHDFLESSLGS